MAWLPGFLARTPTFSRLSYKAVVETPSILNGDEGHSFSWNYDHGMSSMKGFFFFFFLRSFFISLQRLALKVFPGS